MPGILQQIQVTKQSQRMSSFMIASDTFMLVNPDITNNVFIGNDPASQPIAVPALGSVTITPDRNHDIWISSSGPTVTCYLLPNGSNWVPSPAQVAAQINALGLATANNQSTQIGQIAGTVASALIANTGKTIAQEVAGMLASGNALGAAGGIPLLRFTSNLGSASNTNIPAATTQTIMNTVSLNQPGYEGVFTLFMPLNSGTIPFVKIVIVWTDATTGLTVGQRTFFMACGNTQAAQLSYYIHGPTKGNQVSITATNLDPAVAATLTWGFNLTSHVYLCDNIIQTAYGSSAPNGYTNPAGTPNAGVLSNSNVTIPANSTTTRLLAAYSGRAIFMANNTGASGGDINAFLVDPVNAGTGLYGNANSRLQGPGKVTAGNTASTEVALPYGPLLLQLVNLSTTISTGGNFSLLTEDY